MPPLFGNGNNPFDAVLSAVLRSQRPIFTPERIKEMVDQHELDVQSLIRRFESDYNMYRLQEHVNIDPATGEPWTDFAVYTSNAPRVFADKIIAWLSQAEVYIRVPHMDIEGHREEQDNLKERFAIGCIEMANERLSKLLLPSLQASQAFYVSVRGGYLCGRAQLVKRPDGSTYADVTSWDPMHTHFGLGPDGLEWVCYKQKMTRAQIFSTYGVDLAGVNSGGANPGDPPHGSSNTDIESVFVYDFYDGVFNTIVTDGAILKQPTPHGSPRVPVYMTLIGHQPLLQQQNLTDLIQDTGESIFAALRGVYTKNNDIMSAMLEIVERARAQSYVVESRDGKKTLDDNPYKQGTGIPLATGDRIYTLELQKMAQETGAFMNIIAGEIQRGSLPYSVYGEVLFQLSGFAINTLRQGIETVLNSRISAMQEAHKQIVHLLYDQFMTRRFEGMRLSGRDSNRKYFSQHLTPDLLEGTCDYRVQLVSKLPQDDMSRWAMAEIAERGKFLSKGDILNDLVGIQDSQQALDKLKAEMAEQGLPEAMLYTLMMASADRGDTALAQMYLAEFQRIMAVKLGVMPNVSPGGPGQGDRQGAAGAPGGQRPEVMPNAMTGAAPSQATSNNGPARVAPGTPRPAAQGQQDQNRQP